MNIVITGASRGVGYYTALKFARSETNKVYALSRNEAGLKKLAGESEGRIIPVVCDLSDESDVIKAVKTISQQSDSVEILINNAGQLIKRSLEALTLQDWKDVYGVNVFGVFVLIRELLPLLRRGTISEQEKIHSHVVNISSMGGIQGSMKFDGLSAYSSSKGALITMTECLSQELTDAGIRVNCIALGSVGTEMFSLAFPGLKPGGEVGEISKWLAEFSERGWRFFNGKTLPLSTTTP